MRLIGQDVLNRASRRYPDARPWLEKWTVVVKASTWRNIDEVRATYPSADGVVTDRGNVVTVFNVKGNTYRLLTFVSYAMQTMEALELLTHAEYSKQRWKSRH